MMCIYNVQVSKFAFKCNLCRYNTAPPKCKGHRETCKVRKVDKEGPNLGRVFFCCPRPMGKMKDGGDCGFFEWAYGRNQK
jgi:hypothetical protein